MKLKIVFTQNDSTIMCSHHWEDIDVNLVSYFHCEGLMQDLDSFINTGNEIVEIDGRKYVKCSAKSFSYELNPSYSSYMGAHRDYSLSFPFVNSKEFFIGDNCILRPFNKNFKEDFYSEVEIEIVNNTSLKLFSSLERKAGPEQLFLCFIYLTEIDHNYFKEKSKKLEIEIVQSHEASELIPAKELFQDLNRYHSYYVDELGDHKQERLVVLQILADSNFQEITKNQTFATGENVKNAIIIYLPNDGDYIEWLSGHRDYIREVKYGLLHEIGHFYSSKGGDPSKTIITHDPSCSRRDYWLVGENLNGYFTSIIAKKLDLILDDQDFVSLKKSHSDAYRKRQDYAGCLYFTYADEILQKAGSSLWDVYKSMIVEQREKQFLYKSLDYFFDSCEKNCDREAAIQIRSLFQKTPEELLV
jgi:hypothetical protein